MHNGPASLCLELLAAVGGIHSQLFDVCIIWRLPLHGIAGLPAITVRLPGGGGQDSVCPGEPPSLQECLAAGTCCSPSFCSPDTEAGEPTQFSGTLLYTWTESGCFPRTSYSRWIRRSLRKLVLWFVGSFEVCVHGLADPGCWGLRMAIPGGVGGVPSGGAVVDSGTSLGFLS